MSDLRKWYGKFLRDMKAKGLKVDDMPEDVAQSALKVHQAALLDHLAERVVIPEGAATSGPTKWAEIRTGDGKLTGYIELFWGGKLGWVSVPGASRVIDAGSERPS